VLAARTTEPLTDRLDLSYVERLDRATEPAGGQDVAEVRMASKTPCDLVVDLEGPARSPGVPILEEVEVTDRGERRQDARLEEIDVPTGSHPLGWRGRVPPAVVIEHTLILELAP
jgi:hypothetical protein